MADRHAIAKQLFEEARKQGFPALALKPGEQVLPGLENWRRFCGFAQEKKLREAWNRLGQGNERRENAGGVGC